MGAIGSTASRIPRRLEGRTGGDESRARPWNEIGAAASGLPSCGRGAGCGTCSPREAEVRRTCPGLDLGNREALPPMSVGMAAWAPGPMIMEEIRMEALLGPRGGQLLHRGFREEVKDSVGKG